MEEMDPSSSTKPSPLPSKCLHTNAETDGFPTKNIVFPGMTSSDSSPSITKDPKPVTTKRVGNKNLQMTFSNKALNMSPEEIQKTLQQAQMVVNDAKKAGFLVSSAQIPLQKSDGAPGKNYQVNIHTANNVMIGERNTVYNQVKSSPDKNDEKLETMNDSSTQSLDPKFQEKLDFLLGCSKPLTEFHINQISAMIGSDWRRVLRTVGLGDSEIDVVDYNYRDQGLQEKVFQGLLQWSHQSTTCMVKDLAGSLHKLGKKPVLDQLHVMVTNE